jgi:NADP-reducing hydrogenase subunit HndB
MSEATKKKLRPEDLERIKEDALAASELREGDKAIEILVHMGTCGIAAGAEEVFKALNEEIEASGRKDISVIVTGCAGMCSSEPNVTIRRAGEDAVIYRDLDREKMKEIFHKHVMQGEVAEEYALAKIK